MENDKEVYLVPKEQPLANKLYIVVRQDLRRAYQIPQSIHAKDEFTHKYPLLEKKWHEESNTLAVLGVDDTSKLLQLVDELQAAGLKHALFYEPDVEQYTSVAIEPGLVAAELLRELKPAGYNHKKKNKRRRRRYRPEP